VEVTSPHTFVKSLIRKCDLKMMFNPAFSRPIGIRNTAIVNGIVSSYRSEYFTEWRLVTVKCNFTTVH